MSASVIFNPTHKTLPVKDFWVACLPILDRHQNLIAHELRIRSAVFDSAKAIADLSETALVLAHFAELELEKIVGDIRAFIKIDAETLLSEIVESLPKEKIVLDLASGTKATPEVLARIADLSRLGFHFSLNNVTGDFDNAHELLPHVENVRFNLEERPLNELSNVLAQFDLRGKKLLADKVETITQFKTCLDLDFNYFQGYFFAAANIVSGKKLSPSQAAVMRLMSLITTDADSAAIEEELKRDVALGLNLLRLVNTPSIGSHRIDSIKQALMVLGRNQLQRWLQIMLYAEPNKSGQNPKPLLMLATFRGKLLEVIAHKHKPGNSSVGDTAFMVGIMSLMDTLFGMPMAKVLKETAVVDDVSDALLDRKGYYGDLLRFVEVIERTETTEIALASLKSLQLTTEEYYLLQLVAFDWSNSVSHLL